MVTVKIIKDSKEFSRENIRRYFDDATGTWYFSIVDVIGVLTHSTDARNYWKVLKNRLKKADNELVTNCNQLKMKAKDGKFYMTDVANPETLIHIIESVPTASVAAFRILLEEIQTGKIVVKEDEMEEDSGEDAKLLVDAYQTSTHVFIVSMIAGAEPEDINISITSKKVTIKGKRKSPQSSSPDKGRSGGVKFLIEELYWPTFSRVISLPCPIDKEKIETTLEDGLLVISLEKK